MILIPCYHPLKAFYKIDKSSNKKVLHFASQADLDRGFGVDNSGLIYSSPIDIPCGQCIGCRLEYSRQWATRCVLESLKYEYNFFITLTYRDEDLPQERIYRYDHNGEVYSEDVVSSLVPDHVTTFMKDLRRYFSYHYNHDGIRFFCCGEYGDKHMRPHYHIIVFNCPIPDLEFDKTSFNGDVYWRSEIIQDKIWKKGICCIANVNFDTCAYVSRYMLKKQKGLNAHFYDDNGLVAPFTRSSRMPGIAKDYYDQNEDKIYKYDSLVIVGPKGKALKVRPPSYYDRLYDVDHHDELVEIKERRKASAENIEARVLSKTTLDKDQYLAVCESNKSKSVSRLLRPI